MQTIAQCLNPKPKDQKEQSNFCHRSIIQGETCTHFIRQIINAIAVHLSILTTLSLRRCTVPSVSKHAVTLRTSGYKLRQVKKFTCFAAVGAHNR